MRQSTIRSTVAAPDPPALLLYVTLPVAPGLHPREPTAMTVLRHAHARSAASEILSRPYRGRHLRRYLWRAVLRSWRTSMRWAFAGSQGVAGLPDSWPGLMARLVAEYRIHHLIEGLPGVYGNRPECAQAILISRQEAAYVLARVPGTAPLVVLARI